MGKGIFLGPDKATSKSASNISFGICSLNLEIKANWQDFRTKFIKRSIMATSTVPSAPKRKEDVRIKYFSDF